MISETDLEHLLEPFALRLSTDQQHQVLTYLELLLRWNRRINLTAVVEAGECITRHFGESLLLSRHVKLKGQLLDVGSGAGFPGLALKIVAPGLDATLLEPTAKKRAFLKEVVRSCRWTGVEVRAERLEEFAREIRDFDIVTARAVGSLDRLVPEAARCLCPTGRLCLWLGIGQSEAVRSQAQTLEWQEPIPIPLSGQRMILVGIKRST